MDPLTKLNKRQRNFVEYYDGNEVRTMRLAGHEGTDSYLKRRAKDYLNDPLVQKALEYRDPEGERSESIIASRLERQKMWTSLMRNEDPYAKDEVDKYGNLIPKDKVAIPLAIRIKAMEMLAKSEGDFIERIEIDQKVTIDSIVMKSYDVPDEDLDAIEAQYRISKERKLLEASEEEEVEDVEEVNPFEELL